MQEMDGEFVAIRLDILFGAFHMQAHPQGGGFTCNEADALCELYRSVGMQREAQLLFEAHLLSDEEGDAHYEDLRDIPGAIERLLKAKEKAA